MKKKEKRSFCYNKFFPLFLFVATIFMGIGYAATTSISLELTGTAIVKKQEGIYITEANYLTDNNANLENSKIINAYQTMLNSSIELSPTDPNSSITYSVTIYNSTDYPYYFQGINYIENDSDTYSNNDIIYTLNNLSIDDALNSKESVTFTIKFSYKDNIISDDNTLSSFLNFSFKRKYSITYDNLANATNYPTEIYEGETLVLDLSPSNPLHVHVYIDGINIEDFTFENDILTIPNISSNVVIQGVIDDHYDVPITDKDTNFVIVDGSSGETINVRDLFEMEFSGINGSTKVINRIELIVKYTSTTGSKQSIISTLTHNNVAHEQTLSFQGKTNNGTLTITFDNLSIGVYDAFTLSNTNKKLTNGNITIHSEELKIYFEDQI